MAVVYLKEISDGRGGEFNLEGDIVRTRAWHAKTNNNLDDDETIRLALAAVGIDYGAAHPSDSTCRCYRIRPEQIGSTKKAWLIQVSYSDKFTASPTTEPAKINWKTERFTRPLVFDRSDNWVCNSAGFPYDPPAEIDDSRKIARVLKNVAGMPAWFPDGYKDRVNSDAFTIDGRNVSINNAKMMALELSEWKDRNGSLYRELSLEISIDPKGWDVRLLDSGFAEIDSSAPTKRIKISLADGTEPSQPVPLNGSGYRLANPSTTNFFIRTHPAYLQAVFGSLPLT